VGERSKERSSSLNSEERDEMENNKEGGLRTEETVLSIPLWDLSDRDQRVHHIVGRFRACEVQR
jgi:hypothetical protein